MICVVFVGHFMSNLPEINFNKSQLVIVNWAQCVNGQCNHWVHLKYCTEVRHVAHDESFLCPHCTED